jgi:DNA-binding response OmpR family regulator
MAQPDQTPKRVLVVDDDTTLAELICEFLTMGGFRAEHVGDGEAALVVWKTARADLLIVDYSMPGMNGLELITALRRLNGPPGRAIMISGNPVREEALNHGVQTFIAKPFPMQRLLAEVARVLSAVTPVERV